ncbi:MAG: FtsQ-type POTRA domain-containing protein, partial [Alphaproteobacteria bacterium]|nr:FtsQ-type POTRA domain-containing protein [Alphaproteobacteria bacterium]
FVLKEVLVQGRQETNAEDILNAIGMRRGDPMLDFNADEVRKKIEALGWVETASVERKLPDHIIVRLRERVPAAIWQNDKEYILVDRNGVEITKEKIDKYAHLKVLTGKDAPKHALSLLNIIEQVPDLKEHVIGAAWVSDRRWTLHLKDKISVRLPADNPQLAWRKLALMIQDHDLLNRDIELIDLRQPDRTIIRMTGSGAKRILGDEENA